MVIASHIPGRLRLRGEDLRDAALCRSLIQELSELDPTATVTTGRHCGSLLIGYDPARLAPARLTAWATAWTAPRPAPAAPRGGRRATTGWSRTLTGRDANRVAKYGLFASTAVMLLALAGNTRLHAAAGGLNLAFLLVHLVHHRGKWLR